MNSDMQHVLRCVVGETERWDDRFLSKDKLDFQCMKERIINSPRRLTYLPCFWSPNAHTLSPEARCTGARFEPDKGGGAGCFHARPQTHDDNKDYEIFFISTINVPHGTRVHFAALCLLRPPPEGGRRGWILAGVMFKSETVFARKSI